MFEAAAGVVVVVDEVVVFQQAAAVTDAVKDAAATWLGMSRQLEVETSSFSNVLGSLVSFCLFSCLFVCLLLFPSLT